MDAVQQRARFQNAAFVPEADILIFSSLVNESTRRLKTESQLQKFNLYHGLILYKKQIWSPWLMHRNLKNSPFTAILE